MKKGVQIVLDKPRTLRYGINALAKIEGLLGKSLTNLNLNAIGVKDLLVIVYAGLYYEDKTLTVDAVGDLIDEYSSIGEVAKLTTEALNLSFGTVEDTPSGE